MRLCKYCNAKLVHHASKVCDKCFPSHIKAYAQAYREANREACQMRTRRSQAKNPEKYRLKRRETYRKRHGIPLDYVFNKRKNGEGSIDAQGYKTITRKGHPNRMDERGRIREHVFFMSEHLGRPLRKGESVHHKNGDRLDNRIENLELWVKGQPAGQRVEDKISWCIEFLTEYGHEVKGK